MDVVDAAPALRKPPRVRADDEGPPNLWPDGVSDPAPRPRIRRIIANTWLREHVSRRVAAILHADLRRAEAEIEADGGRGTDTALALAAELHRRIEAGPIDLRGSAPDLCRQLGLEVSDRAAREAVRRLAAHTLLLSAGSRHESAAVRLRSLWNRGTFELEADPLAWRHDPHGAISQWHAANLSQRSGDTCSPAYKERAGGDDVGDQVYEFDSRTALNIPRMPGPRPSPRMLDSLERRGFRCDSDLSKSEAALAHQLLRERFRSTPECMNLTEIQRYWTLATGPVLAQLDAADVGRLERKLSLAGLQAPSAARAAAINEYVFERLGSEAMALNIACGIASQVRYGECGGRFVGEDHGVGRPRISGSRGEVGRREDPAHRQAVRADGGACQARGGSAQRARGRQAAPGARRVNIGPRAASCGRTMREERVDGVPPVNSRGVEGPDGQKIATVLSSRDRHPSGSWRWPRIAFALRGVGGECLDGRSRRQGGAALSDSRRGERMALSEPSVSRGRAALVDYDRLGGVAGQQDDPATERARTGVDRHTRAVSFGADHGVGGGSEVR